MPKQPKKILPRLAGGEVREQLYSSLPEDYKAGIRAIAQDENASINWVVNEILLDWINEALRKHGRRRIPAPKYVTKKVSGKKIGGKVIKMRRAS